MEKKYKQEVESLVKEHNLKIRKKLKDDKSKGKPALVKWSE